MEAISSSKIYMDLLEGKISNCCEYYSKPEADAVIARLQADLFQAQAKSSRLEARCGDLQDDVDRFMSVLKYISEKRLGNYSHLDFYDIQEMAKSALSAGR